MNDVQSQAALAKHRIPVIDRMMDVLFLLERRTGGATIRDLVNQLQLPRTTVYRILNTLQAHDMVRRSEDGAYRLGPRLLALAAHATPEDHDFDLARLALPHLQRLSAETGEGCKISIIDGGGLLVLAAIEGKREYAPTVTAGQRLPLHAGAAGKVLLAGLDPAARARRLGGELPRYTDRTLTDRERLGGELDRIARQGWAEDKGEYAPSIHAFAAPVVNRDGTVLAALSTPYLAGAGRAHMETLRLAVIATAGTISANLPTPGRRR